MLAKLFGFDAKKHTVKTEVLAGITTFLTMAYILAVNPNIFSALEPLGMDSNAVFTATALAAIVGTLIMSVYAKKPFGLAPGMGLNAFFVFTVCLGMGKPWQFALTAVFIEGVIFILLTLTNLREAIVNAIPDSIKNAIGAGIGLFIAFIGMQNAGLIVSNDATLVSLGNITEGAPLLAVIGLVITGVLFIMNVKGAILIGIVVTALIGIPMGLTNFNGVVSTPPSIAPIFVKFTLNEIFTLDMLVVVFTFLFIDIFDTIGTVVGVSKKSGMMDADGKIPDVKKIFMADAIATTAGACFGTSTTTTYVESASGVAEGGRTGLTSFTIVVCFVIALLFSPVFLAIPGAATAPALIVVGLFMMSPIKNIDLDDYSESIPAFITLVMMPFAYSISDGIMLGMISYVLLNTVCGKFKKISVVMWILSIAFLCKYILL
ncbi:MAG TPA: NCS2 family permease [Bacteroidaceae bacterium]|nr:NCS2 family permease [Bacteroidaceae bacterium]